MICEKCGEMITGTARPLCEKCQFERHTLKVYIVFCVESGQAEIYTDEKKATDRFFNTRAANGDGWTITTETLEGNLKTPIIT
jgi:hypothetical protein